MKKLLAFVFVIGFNFCTGHASSPEWSQGVSKLKTTAIGGDKEILGFYYSIYGKMNTSFWSWVPEDKGDFMGVMPSEEDSALPLVFEKIEQTSAKKIILCTAHSHPLHFPKLLAAQNGTSNEVKKKYAPYISKGTPSSPPSDPDIIFGHEILEVVKEKYPDIEFIDRIAVADALGLWIAEELNQNETAAYIQKIKSTVPAKYNELAKTALEFSSGFEIIRMKWFDFANSTSLTADQVVKSDLYPILRLAYAKAGAKLSFVTYKDAISVQPCGN